LFRALVIAGGKNRRFHRASFFHDGEAQDLLPGVAVAGAKGVKLSRRARVVVSVSIDLAVHAGISS